MENADEASLADETGWLGGVAACPENGLLDAVTMRELEAHGYCDGRRRQRCSHRQPRGVTSESSWAN